MQEICDGCRAVHQGVTLLKCGNCGKFACGKCTIRYQSPSPVESWILLCPFCGRNCLEVIGEASKGSNEVWPAIRPVSRGMTLVGKGVLVLNVPLSWSLHSADDKRPRIA
jgi:hypothetical protein